MIASTSHQVPSEIIHYLIKQGSQLFMQEAGDEVTNHQPDRIPKFSSFIRPLMAGLLKTFVYAPMGNTPPRFVYRYVVISVEGFLLYFDTSSSDSQDHVPLEQADNKLPLFHSSNIHGKMNLNDLSYTIAIKSANQEDVDISEVLSNSSSQANVGSSASPRQKVLRRLYSKDEMIGSYLHTSPSSSPKGKARHLLESIAEDNTTVIASPQTKASDQSSSSKASKPQLDFPIEFNIPSLSFTWIFYTENVMEQIRWYTAFMKFLRYDKTDNVAGTVIKLKKAPMLPPQVNTHPSTR